MTFLSTFSLTSSYKYTLCTTLGNCSVHLIYHEHPSVSTFLIHILSSLGSSETTVFVFLLPPEPSLLSLHRRLLTLCLVLKVSAASQGSLPRPLCAHTGGLHWHTDKAVTECGFICHSQLVCHT